MTSWDVRTKSGRFIGLYAARSAEIAFSICMNLRGYDIEPGEIIAKEIEPYVCEITCRGEVYVLTGTPHD